MKNYEHLGDKVKDIVSGTKGIASAECRYLNGCVQIEISPKAKEDGTLVPSLWVDVQQVRVVTANPLKLRPVAESKGHGSPAVADTPPKPSKPRKVVKRNRGGPQSTPPGMSHP